MFIYVAAYRRVRHLWPKFQAQGRENTVFAHVLWQQRGSIEGQKLHETSVQE